MPALHLSLDHARTALLHAQGLIDAPPVNPTPADVLDTIRRMHVLQIDTISVVNRSPYLVLHSRIGSHPTAWLTDVLAGGQLFEYWSHAACFLPIEDFAYHRRFMLERRGRGREWFSRNMTADTLEKVREHVRTHGAVRSADFERADGDKGGWWNWKAEKVALEYLFDIGEVMVARREGFQRIYDLQERVYPWDDAHTPEKPLIYRRWVMQTLQALGTAPEVWLADYFRIKRADARAGLKSLLEAGEVVEVSVEGQSVPWYALRDMLPTLQRVVDGQIVPTRTVLLSPFDPVVWDRSRLLGMFGMDYKIEVYTPEHKRKYGYFSLPILHHGRMVGRLDPKAHRAQKRLEIRAVHLEDGVSVDSELVQALADTLREFAVWHGTPEVQVQPVGAVKLAKTLAKQLSQ
jgi:uncharacterized protein YcaQ